MDIGQKVRFKSTGKYASVHMKGHKGTIISTSDPLVPECGDYGGPIDVKCDTCGSTHYSYEDYVSPVKEKVAS